MNHTPGPWIVNDHDYDRFGKTVGIEAEHGNFICELVRDGQHREFDNARLIAAAPDLLEALREMIIAFSPDIYRVGAAAIGRATDADAVHARARALIDKVDGMIG